MNITRYKFSEQQQPMQTNRRRADMSFRIDTFVEKKNCLRCYRMHKKYSELIIKFEGDGVTPSCSRCAKAKSACVYTYDSTESKSNTPDTNQTDLSLNVANLQQSLEQQKQAYRQLEEQLGQIKAQNMTLQQMNMQLSQALSAKVMQENHLASASEKQDVLSLYNSTGYYYIRVTPLFNDVYQYMQEKTLGRNPLKTVTMELMFGATYMLLGKMNEGYHYLNTALTVMTSNNLNSPMGIVCMHMLAENLFIAGKKLECTIWLQKIRAMFTDMDNSMTDPNKSRIVHNQLTTMSQIMDVNFARSVSIMWTQWVPQQNVVNHRIDQYLKQLEAAKLLEDPIYRTVNSPCCVPTFYILRSFLEIIVALEHQIDTPDEIPIVTERDITMHFNELVAYSRTAGDPKMRQNFTRGIIVFKILIAVIAGNYVLFDQLMAEVISAGYLDEESPNPHNSMPLFILLQLLYFVQSPILTKAVHQFEGWSKSFPSYKEVYRRWVDLVTGPSIYPVQLNEFEDYFLVLPHLNYMRQHNIVFDMYPPIFEEERCQIMDISDSLLLTPFDVNSPPSGIESSDKSPSEYTEQYSDSSLLGDVAFGFTPDFNAADYEIDSVVNN